MRRVGRASLAGIATLLLAAGWSLLLCQFQALAQPAMEVTAVSQDARSFTGAVGLALGSVEPTDGMTYTITLPLIFRNYPPIPVLNPVPTPGANNSYRVSWEPVSASPGQPIDGYVLQEATHPDFTTDVTAWPRTANTCVDIDKGSTYGTFYYRVRADDDDRWGEGPWSHVESVSIGFHDDFNDPGSGWPDDRGVMYEDRYWKRGYRTSSEEYRIKIDQGGPDAWFYQPDALAPYRPPSDKYCVETKVRFEKGGWWANMGLVFGSNEDNTDIYALCLARDADPDRLGWFLMRNDDYDFPRLGCSGPTDKIEGGDRSGTSREGWNRLQVGVDGDQVTVYIGGHYKGQWTMDDLSATTQVGIIGGDCEITPIDVRFDYFEVIPNVSCTP